MARPDVTRALQDIADLNSGRITPIEVVAVAKNKNSVLHQFFTWNVRAAARECWIEQARSLIRSVHIEVRTTHYTIQAPVYVRDPTVESKTQGYTSLTRLRTDEEATRDLLCYEFGRASAALARAKSIAAALGMSDEIGDLQSRIIDLSGRASEGPRAAA